MGKGRAPCCDKSKVKKGPWSSEEDLRLIAFIQKNGHGNWRSLPKQAGLLRCGKSCRLRWINYLRPDVKRGNFTPQEEDTIIKLHQSFGNKWSKIASHLPGRTDNEIKNVWNTHLKKRLMKKLNDHDKFKEDRNSCASPSSSSSTSIVSHTNWHQDINSTKANEKEEFKVVNDDMLIEKAAKETSKSCSPTTSYGSNLSNLTQIDTSSPNVDMDNWILSPKISENNDGLIDLPLMDSDTDFWDMLDILGPSPNPPNSESNINIPSAISIVMSSPNSESKQDTQPTCEGVSEFECQKWLRYLENELGLNSEGNYDNCIDAVTFQD